MRPIHKCTDSQRLPPSYTQYQRTLKACARRTRRALTSSHPNTVKVSDVLLESVPADSSYDVPVFQRQVIALVLYLVAGRYPKIPEVQLLKEVIQPQVPLRLPCYDFTPIANQTVDASLLAVGATASGPANSRGVTGGVYKARERIHRGMLIRDY